LAFVADRAYSFGRRTAIILLAATSAGLLAIDTGELREFTKRISEPEKRWPGSPVSHFVLAHTSPGDAIWAPWKPLVYHEAKRLSPTKWHFVFDHLFVTTPSQTADEKFRSLRADLQTRPPRLIVVNPPLGENWDYPDRFLARSGLADWISANYVPVFGSRSESHEVLMLRRPSAAR